MKLLCHSCKRVIGKLVYTNAITRQKDEPRKNFCSMDCYKQDRQQEERKKHARFRSFE